MAQIDVSEEDLEGLDDSDKNNSDSKESDSDDSDSSFNLALDNISKIRSHLLDNPYDYDSHIKMIEAIQASQNFKIYDDLIKEARENMSSKFPLTPKLWLDWIQDEIDQIRDENKRAKKDDIIALFDRALRDYISIDIWMKYADFVISFIDEPIEWITEKFERALNEVGLHVSKGTLIWETYREILIGLASIAPEDTRLSKYEQVFDLYKRQLSIPLYGMQHIYKEFQEWCTKIKETYPEFSGSPESIKFSYDQAYALLQKIQMYEDELLSTDKPSLDAYLKYIEFEETNGTPPRVQCIYERALIDYCLVPELWVNYTKYLDKKVKIPKLVKKTYERAIRNYPWNVNIWINYIRSCENNKDFDLIMDIFERALAVGFQSGEEVRELWLTYLDYLRRQTDWKDNEQVERLKKTFQAGIDHLSNFQDGDPNAILYIYLAKIHAKYLNSIETSRSILSDLFSQKRDISMRAEMWMEYANFERYFGDEKHYKKVLLKSLTSVNDWPEMIGFALLKYEREEGSSLTQYEEILEKYDNVLKRIGEKREKTLSKTYESNKNREHKREKYETNNTERKRKKFDDNNDESGKKKTQGEASTSKKIKLSASVTTDEAVINEMKRQAEVKQQSDETKKLNTVFLSNLDFKLNEDKIREIFSEFGKIIDLRLVRNYKGLSKGFCYIEYEDIKGAREALKHDRMIIESRPVFISEMNKKSEFKFKNTKETNKVFVKGLSVRVNEEMLKKFFEKYGELKDVRLVTYRNGHSKGCAYIEFTDEIAANKALEADGMLLGDKNIKVAISDPSARFEKQEKALGSGQSQSSIHLGQAKKKIDITSLIPTSVRKTLKNGTESH